MYSFLFGNYYYEKDIIIMINTVEKNRKKKRLSGKIMNSTFADDLKDIIMGVDREMDNIIKNSYTVSTKPNF